MQDTKCPPPEFCLGLLFCALCSCVQLCLFYPKKKLKNCFVVLCLVQLCAAVCILSKIIIINCFPACCAFPIQFLNSCDSEDLYDYLLPRIELVNPCIALFELELG